MTKITAILRAIPLPLPLRILKAESGEGHTGFVNRISIVTRVPRLLGDPVFVGAWHSLVATFLSPWRTQADT